MRTKPPIRLNALCLAKFIRFMQDNPSNVYDLAEFTGLTVQTCGRYLRALEKEKAIYTTAWETDSRNRYTTKIFVLGQGNSVPRPKPVKSMLVRRRERRGRKKMAQVLQLMAA